MRFHSRTEAYLYALYVLEHIPASDLFQKKRIVDVISAIKIAIENHEENPVVVANLIDALQIENNSSLRILSAALKNSGSYKKLSQKEKWEAPLARRLESEMHIEFLKNPTAKMQQVINKASQKIIKEIDKLSQNVEEYFLRNLTNSCNPLIGFGSFKNKPTKEEVISLLALNSSDQLSEILFIQLQFSKYFVRKKEVLGQLAEKGIEISDTRMYHSDYYRDRGRYGHQEFIFTSQFGLHTSRDSFFKKGFSVHSSSWAADARSQQPDFNSHYVKSLIEHDTPYVAGPSGLTSLFVAAVYALDFFDSVEEIRLYIASFASYIVSAGFHSLHEVLGPIAYCLAEENLIPGYLTCIPNEKTDIPSPLYHVFYDLIGKIDSEFLERREVAWQKTLSFFKDFYLNFSPHLKKQDELTDKVFILLAIEEYEKTLDVGELHSLAMIKHYMELIAASEDAFLWNIVNDLLDLYESSSLKEIMTRHLGFSSVDLFISHVLFSRDVFALGDRLPLVDDVASVMKPPSF